MLELTPETKHILQTIFQWLEEKGERGGTAKEFQAFEQANNKDASKHWALNLLSSELSGCIGYRESTGTFCLLNGGKDFLQNDCKKPQTRAKRGMTPLKGGWKWERKKKCPQCREGVMKMVLATKPLDTAKEKPMQAKCNKCGFEDDYTKI